MIAGSERGRGLRETSPESSWKKHPNATSEKYLYGILKFKEGKTQAIGSKKIRRLDVLKIITQQEVPSVRSPSITS